MKQEEKNSSENLISKKALLSKYSISYGALYRWKRMGLIPEDWFIKKSTVTGQETFFPKALVCERIELIRNAKDDLSLDELAEQLSGKKENDESLLLITEFGDKSFRLCDIKSVYIVSGDNEKRDVTTIIENLFTDNTGKDNL